jgi:hypothetical protein
MNEKPEIEQKPIESPKEMPTHEISGFLFSSAVKIYDPNSKEVMVQIRGDN